MDNHVVDEFVKSLVHISGENTMTHVVKDGLRLEKLLDSISH